MSNNIVSELGGLDDINVFLSIGKLICFIISVSLHYAKNNAFRLVANYPKRG